MDGVTKKLAAAQAEVQRAEAELRRRDGAHEKLAQVRELGSRKKREYEKLEAKLRAAVIDETNTEKHVSQALTELNNYSANSPSDLPSHAELARWNKNCQLLRQQLADCAARKGTARATANELRVKYMQASEELQNLRHQESTLVRIANGENLAEPPGWAKGGLSAVR
jgi:hypothetical protein